MIVRAVLPIAQNSWIDIATRLAELGPEYKRDFLDLMGRAHGPLLLFGETALSVEHWNSIDPEARRQFLAELKEL